MKLKLLKLLIIPLLLTLGYFILASYPYFFSKINRSDSLGPLSLVEEKPVNIQKTNHLLKGDKVTVKLGATENNLGIVLVKFAKFGKVSDRIMFRIKEEGKDNWYYENKYRAEEFKNNEYFTFGFPPLTNSKNNIYVFEIESLTGTSKNAIGIIPHKPQTAFVYKYSVSELKNYKTFFPFAFKKFVYVARNVNYWQIAAIFILSFLAGLFMRKKKITISRILGFLSTLKKEHRRIFKVITGEIKSKYLFLEKRIVNLSKKTAHWFTSAKFYSKFPKTKKKLIFVSILTLFILVISLIVVEISSILLIKKMGLKWEPVYLRLIKGYTSANLIGGRTEYHSWGPWNTPNYEGRIANYCIDVKYKFNSYGARDKDRSTSGQGRTLVFGDSFIEGWGVDQDKILAAELEKISEREFLNFGNSGSGFAVLNEYILYRDFASKYEHDSVIVGLTVGNDFADNDLNAWQGLAMIYYRPFFKLSDDKKDVEAVYPAKKVEGKYLLGLEPENKAAHFTVYTSWKEFSAFLSLFNFIQSNKLYFSKDSALAKKFNYNLEFSDDTITASLLAHEKFSKLIGNKKKYLIIIPSVTDVYYYLNSKKQNAPKMEKFKNSLSHQGWQVIDLIDVFANLPQDKIPEYFICDGHWSAKGNELVAEYLYKIMKTE